MIRSCVLVAVLIIAGCGSKRDCDGYARHVADLSDPAPGRHDQLVAFSRDLCERGRISDRELACVERARTRDALIECTTGKPAIHVADDAATAAPRVDASRSNAVRFVRIENGEGFHPLDLDKHADQRAWIEQLEQDVAACAGDETYEPREYAVVVTFSPQASTISLGGLPAPASFCVRGVLARRQPASVGNGPALVYIDVGR